MMMFYISRQLVSFVFLDALCFPPQPIELFLLFILFSSLSSLYFLINSLLMTRFVHIYPVWICIALVFSQTDTSLEDLFFDEPDNSNLFLDDSGGGPYLAEPFVLADSAFMNPTLLADDASNDMCISPLPPSGRIRARQKSCNNPDNVGGIDSQKSTMTAEEIQQYWCPATNAPLQGFGNVPVCYRRAGLDPLALYFPILENCELSKISMLEPQLFGIAGKTQYMKNFC